MPEQCPACGCSLEGPSTVAVPGGDRPCPRCGGHSIADASNEVSVRPPDLEPGAVRDRSPDVLAGWDVGVGAEEIKSWRRDRRPFPTDTVIVLGAAAVGVALGRWFLPQHRTRGAVSGALTGVVTSAVTRRVWRLRA